MSFAENLQQLRKREKITQEELAEELDVSRQSVSKWETGEAFPEIDKLVVICEKFGVDMDNLVRGDIVNNQADGEQEEKVYADDIGFSKHMDGFSVKISAGVFMILAGVALLLTFLAVAEIAGQAYVNLFAVLGIVSLFLPTAAAVFLFILSGINHSEFVKAHGEAKNYFTKEQCAAFNKKFSIGIAVCVSVIILAVTGLAVSYTVSDGFVYSSKALREFVDKFIVAVFMFILAFPVGALCCLGIRHSKYDVAEYNRNNIKQQEKGKSEKIKDGVQTAIMLLATAVFLLLGFVWNLWHPGWVVFPIGGLLCAAVGAIWNINK